MSAATTLRELALPPDTLSVAQLSTRVQLALRDRLGDALWVAGEISGKKVRSQRVYFDLLDRPDPAAPPRAKVRVVCQPAAARRIGAATRTAGVRLDDGVPVRLLGRLTVWPQGGVYQLDMVDVDAPWTLGQQLATREATLSMLAEEGVLAANSAHPQPLLPIRVALVTSPGTHAAADFARTLEESGFGFQVKLFPTLVQGADAPRQIAAALSRVGAHRAETRWRPDMVVCVRGGGARSDLAAWDDPTVARAIAAVPHPVLVAVGHELDRSIADEAAAVSVKTPTAAAHWLVDVVAGRLAHLDELVATAERTAAGSCAAAQSKLELLSRRAPRAADAHLVVAANHTRLAAGAATAASRRALTSRADATARLASRPRPATERQLERAAAALQLAVAHTRAADPARILARGFSITRLADGSVLRDAADAPPGARLTSTVAAGTVHSTVERAG